MSSTKKVLSELVNHCAIMSSIVREAIERNSDDGTRCLNTDHEETNHILNHIRCLNDICVLVRDYYNISASANKVRKILNNKNDEYLPNNEDDVEYECENCENKDICDNVNNLMKSADSSVSIKAIEIPPDSDIHDVIRSIISKNSESDDNPNDDPVEFVNLMKRSMDECGESNPYGNGDDIPFIHPNDCTYEDEDPNHRIARAIVDIATFVSSTAVSYDSEGTFKITQHTLDKLNHAVEKLNRTFEEINN